jgi:hypothetical protein
MKPQPITVVWSGTHLTPITRYHNVAANMFGEPGTVHVIELSSDRNAARHKACMAALHEAYDNLPEDIAKHFDNFDHFRADALIRTGHCDTRQVDEKLVRGGKHIRVSHPYSQISVSPDGKWVIVKQPKSQAFNAMGEAEAKQVESDLIDYAASLIGVPVGQLRKEAGRSA